MLEIIDQRDALLEEKYLNDDWWYELDYWLNKMKLEKMNRLILIECLNLLRN
ncbi:hypothetical protein ACQVHB_14545 (plasmid) [Staphylococcus aureus]|uniref:hypothetical protein n=1 Tax=Staphylococcus aureus TaxID=1280 RepID=UPI003D1DE4E6